MVQYHFLRLDREYYLIRTGLVTVLRAVQQVPYGTCHCELLLVRTVWLATS